MLCVVCVLFWFGLLCVDYALVLTDCCLLGCWFVGCCLLGLGSHALLVVRCLLMRVV